MYQDKLETPEEFPNKLCICKKKTKKKPVKQNNIHTKKENYKKNKTVKKEDQILQRQQGHKGEEKEEEKCQCHSKKCRPEHCYCSATLSPVLRVFVFNTSNQTINFQADQAITDKFLTGESFIYYKDQV